MHTFQLVGQGVLASIKMGKLLTSSGLVHMAAKTGSRGSMFQLCKGPEALVQKSFPESSVTLNQGIYLESPCGFLYHLRYTGLGVVSSGSTGGTRQAVLFQPCLWSSSSRCLAGFRGFDTSTGSFSALPPCTSAMCTRGVRVPEDPESPDS